MSSSWSTRSVVRSPWCSCTTALSFAYLVETRQRILVYAEHVSDDGARRASDYGV